LDNAKALAETLQAEGLRIVSGGTDNHLMLVDVFAGGTGITGKVAEKALDAVHITANKNTIPFDTNSPFTASGIRLGTPALTTRGMKEDEMRQIGKLIASIIREPESETVKANVKREVAELTSRFSLYAHRAGENNTEAVSAS
jgi:glycine hydroxymethyltransferase